MIEPALPYQFFQAAATPTAGHCFLFLDELKYSTTGLESPFDSKRTFVVSATARGFRYLPQHLKYQGAK
jgi:hypothetical protein